jgi:hypothetical protein
MKIIGITSTAILSLVLGVAAPAYAQHEDQGENQDHAKQEQGGHEQAGHEPQHAQQQHAQEQQQRAQQQQDQHNQQQTQQEQRHQDQHSQQQAQQEQRQQDQHNQQQAQQEQRQQGQHSQQQAREREQPQRGEQQQRVQQSAWQEHRSHDWRSDHRDWQQRGGYRGYRIPDDRYRGYFGPSHGFRINGLPFLVVGGYPRFQYQGYWISTVDPWPEYWGNDWYDNDDVYVNYVDNGYYLYNRRYPGEGIAINITL